MYFKDYVEDSVIQNVYLNSDKEVKAYFGHSYQHVIIKPSSFMEKIGMFLFKPLLPFAVVLRTMIFPITSEKYKEVGEALFNDYTKAKAEIEANRHVE